jgi:hypothetical protein
MTELSAAGVVLDEACDFTRHSVRRARELVARVAANPAVATFPADSLVRASVWLAECSVLCREDVQESDRECRFVREPAEEDEPMPHALLCNSAERVTAAQSAMEKVTNALMTHLHDDGAVRALECEWPFYPYSGQGSAAICDAVAAGADGADVNARCIGFDIVLQAGACALNAWILGHATLGSFERPYFHDADIIASSAYPVFADAVLLMLRVARANALHATPAESTRADHAATLLEQLLIFAAQEGWQLLRESAAFRRVRDALEEDGGAAIAALRAVAAALDDFRRSLPPGALPLPPPQRVCSAPGCSQQEGYVGLFKKCSRCGRPRYCSKACQAAHWKAGHKRECKLAAAATAGGASGAAD